MKVERVKILFVLFTAFGALAKAEAFTVLLNSTAQAVNGSICLKDLGQLTGADQKTNNRWISICHVKISSGTKTLVRKDLEILFWQHGFAAEKIVGQQVSISEVISEAAASELSKPKFQKVAKSKSPELAVRRGETIRVKYQTASFEIERMLKADKSALPGQTIQAVTPNGTRLQVLVTGLAEGVVQ